MKLDEYISKHGVGVKQALHKKTGLRWATIHDIAHGRQRPTVETAKIIEAATDGEVTALEVLGLSTGTDG